jgi:hypothetical protein
MELAFPFEFKCRYTIGLTALLISVFFTLILPLSLFSQNARDLAAIENSLKLLRDSIRHAENDSTRILLSRQFDQKIREAFSLPDSYLYPFDSLKSTGILKSPDNEFRLCSWNVPLLNGHFLYSGLIQWDDKKYPDRKIIFFADKSDSIPAPEKAILDPGHWYGALYYKIIPESSGTKVFYTLLGWKGIDSRVTQKIIEIISFDAQGNALFGKKLFPGYQAGSNTRIIFRFSAEASMTLRYDEQPFTLKKKWNASKRDYEIRQKKVWMIICDRLVPIDEDLEGQFQFYIPAADIFDGFIYGQEGWKFSKGIEARNR